MAPLNFLFIGPKPISNLRSKDYVFSLSELNDEEVSTVEALQAFKKDHGIQDCAGILNGGTRSLKDRIEDMAGNNMLALAEKRAKREVAKKAATDAEAAIGTVASTSTPQSPHPDATKVIQDRPRKKARTEELKGSHDSGKCDDYRIFFSFGTIDEVAALPQIKKDFEAVSKKLKEDEVKMQDVLKKVKGLSDDNIRLTDRNKELEEEVEKLKSALATKKSEATQAVIEKQKMAEDLEDAKKEWKFQATRYEKEIQRVEDLWDESAEIFFHNAIDQIKFLNPEDELRTKGMSTLCVVRDGKWYRGTGKFFVEEAPSDVEITPPPMQPITLEADVVRDEMKGPTESEMVDAKILGLDDSRPLGVDANMPSTAEE
ncbi:hypothetical protein SESBI_29524 [Sesbania bispinosa]|nr:hypothetical protein SESBI_29524 [Sesbania bispinosa]